MGITELEEKNWCIITRMNKEKKAWNVKKNMNWYCLEAIFFNFLPSFFLSFFLLSFFPSFVWKATIFTTLTIKWLRAIQQIIIANFFIFSKLLFTSKTLKIQSRHKGNYIFKSHAYIEHIFENSSVTHSNKHVLYLSWKKKYFIANITFSSIIPFFPFQYVEIPCNWKFM